MNKTLAPILVLVIVTAVGVGLYYWLFNSGSQPSSAESAEEVLVILDLSASVNDKQIDKIPSIVGNLISKAPPGSHISIHVLGTQMETIESIYETDIGQSSTLIGSSLSGNPQSETTDFLSVKLRQIREGSPSRLTSCFLSSMIFAGQYLNERSKSSPLQTRVVVWVGDMIEECPDARFVHADLPYLATRFSSMDVQSVFGRVDFGNLTGSIYWPPDTSLKAVLLPRELDDKNATVSSDVIRKYWEIIPAKLMRAPITVDLETPEELGIGFGMRHQGSSFDAHGTVVAGAVCSERQVDGAAPLYRWFVGLEMEGPVEACNRATGGA